MKKIVSLIIIMSLLLIALTGCVNIRYETTLNENGSADVIYSYGLKKDILEQLN